MIKPYRAWINQPSTLQPAHKYHGMQGIVLPCSYDDSAVELWFSVGDIHSMIIPKECLSLGDRPTDKDSFTVQNKENA